MTYTGPGNYATAHALADDARQACNNERFEEAAVLAAIGQIYATLAVAAATALHKEPADIQGWRDVTNQDGR
jgi:hypothetical protein